MSQDFGLPSVNNNNINSFNTIHNFISPDDEAKILAWLSPLEPGTRHRDIGARQVENIGAWLLETEEFRRWHDGCRDDEANHATLFCHGSPGVGKSYITWLVIDKLSDEANEDTKVIFFYFDFAARSEQSPASMLGSLLRQLVGGLKRVPEVVVQTFRKQGSKGLRIPGILNLFQAITATKRTFICVDALDECAPEHRMTVLGSLGQILQKSPNTYLFMTGRSYVRGEMERKLGRAVTFMLIKPTEDGILRFLRDKLRDDPNPDTMNSRLETDIMETIPKITSEMFLLASIYIKAILEGTTLAERRKALKSIGDSEGLGEAYDVTLERIKAQKKGETKLAMATLTWVCHSERPLEADELRHALAVDRETTDLDPEHIPQMDKLLHCCQGLIVVDEKDSVRLVHNTVKNYLCNRQGFFSTPHSILAETCLAYLSSRQVNGLTPRSLPDHQYMPFLRYSSRYWGTHAGKELSGHARTLALKLLEHYEDHVSAGSLLRQEKRRNFIKDISVPLRFSGLHVASFFGIVELVDVIIGDGGCGVNERDCTDSTPLVWAARNGHVGAAELLLGHKDIQPDRADQYGRTPLGCAALNGNEGVVKLLLKQEGVDPNRSDKHDETPLGWAAINGYEGVVKLLLKREGIDPNRPDVNDRTPLGCAAIEGHEGVVRLLLKRDDVDPDHLDKFYQTPLWCAAFKGHEGVVKLLLEQEDVDPDRPDVNSQTPLGCAAIEGHEGVAKLLLKRDDVDPDRLDKYNRTPLVSATIKGHEGVVELLRERGPPQAG